MLNSAEQEFLDKNLRRMRAIINMMQDKNKETRREVKRLLEIKGDTRNSNSIFDRLHISPNLDFERIMHYEFDDEEFSAV